MSKEKGCSRAVRDLPLTRYRLSRDGRKWRVLARARAGLLLHLSTFANGDGSFEKELPGGAGAINYSPSEKRLLEHWAKDSLYRYLNDLHELGLLSWTRPDHYHKRAYTIHIDHTEKPPPNSAGNHVRDSHVASDWLGTKHVRDSSIERPEHVRDSQKTGTRFDKNTSDSYSPVPSLPSFSPSKSLEPSTPPAPKTGAGVPLDFPITSYEIAHLRREAKEHGWSKAEFDALLQTFGVDLAKHLTHSQYVAALRFIEQAVAIPPGLRNVKSR